jgi:fucose 4-O-acetylase-like acetyltransferase
MMTKRIFALDNLRTLMIFFVVVIHSGLVYENALASSWIVNDPIKNDSIGLVRMYLDLFVMFTFFFISGYFAPPSLKNKNTGAFIWAKFKRIMIPWVIAVFTLIPAYKYIFLYSRGMPQERWTTYFHFFNREGGNPYLFSDNPVMNWLWFLPVLFLFQLGYLILAKSGILKLKISLTTAVLSTFIMGIVYGMIISQLELTGWYHSFFLHFQRERLLIYLMVFLLGTLCYGKQIFDWERWKLKYYILANVLLTIGLGLFTVVALNLFFNLIDPEREYYFVSPFVDRLAYYTFMMMSMLSFIHILLYSFRKYLNHAGKFMRILNRNSYSVYIIHLVVIGILALFMLPLSLPAFVKFLILAVLSFAASNLLVSAYRWIRGKLGF